ncbi:MAG: hypothetical protein GY757_07950, partial [bacterium]|nr:hypothetical protein [bacterium]
MIRISEAGDSGIKKSSLQYSFKFALTDDGTDLENGTGFSVGFGETGEHDVSMGCEEGVETICFDGHKAVLGRAVEFYDSVHEMRVLIDIDRETLSLFIDGRIVLENLVLPRGFEIEPTVSFSSSSVLELDDISVEVISLNKDNEELSMTLFTEGFEGYKEGIFSNQKFFRGSRGAVFQKSPPGRRRQKGETSVIKDNVSGNKLLRLDGSSIRKVTLTKEFSLPEKYPFDTSDKTFKIVYNSNMLKTHMQSSRSGRQDEAAEAYNGPSTGGETPGTASNGALEYTYYI